MHRMVSPPGRTYSYLLQIAQIMLCVLSHLAGMSCEAALPGVCWEIRVVEGIPGPGSASGRSAKSNFFYFLDFFDFVVHLFMSSILRIYPASPRRPLITRIHNQHRHLWRNLRTIRTSSQNYAHSSRKSAKHTPTSPCRPSVREVSSRNLRTIRTSFYMRTRSPRRGASKCARDWRGAERPR
jgi:hypothetical protein